MSAFLFDSRMASEGARHLLLTEDDSHLDIWDDWRKALIAEARADLLRGRKGSGPVGRALEPVRASSSAMSFP